MCACFRLDKILQTVPFLKSTCLGFAFDSAEEITIFVGFESRRGIVWDMPCVGKASMPIDLPSEMQSPPTEEGRAQIGGARLKEKIGKITVPKVNKSARGSAATETICTIEQQVEFLYDGGLKLFAPKNKWATHAGPPALQKSQETDPQSVPDTLVLVSDQDRSLALATGALRWIGCRVIHHCDFNHRDDNDAKLVPFSLKMALNVLGRCSTGPFGTGKWRKYVVESAVILSADEPALKL